MAKLFRSGALLQRSIATKEAQLLQEAALEENCILVDVNDQPLGYGSKRDCHRVNPDGGIKLHRAFSVFLFNSDGDMLVQKRSSHKVSSMAMGKNNNQFRNENEKVFKFLCDVYMNWIGISLCLAKWWGSGYVELEGVLVVES